MRITSNYKELPIHETYRSTHLPLAPPREKVMGDARVQSDSLQTLLMQFLQQVQQVPTIPSEAGAVRRWESGSGGKREVRAKGESRIRGGRGLGSEGAKRRRGRSYVRLLVHSFT
jgi:hypothetical protein